MAEQDEQTTPPQETPAAPPAAEAKTEAAEAKPEPPAAEPKAEAPEAKPEPPAAPADAEEAAPAAPPEPVVTPAAPARPLPPGRHYVWGTGRRKAAIARVRIRPGKGTFLVNKQDAGKYFDHERDRQAILAPLQAAKMVNAWDVWANVQGGGYTGQAGAVVLGLARALAKAMPECEGALRDHGLLTRDARMKERKKPGQPGARKRFQFSKR